MNEKEEYIEAVKNDEHYEWEISDGLILDTDVEFDGTFLPTVVDIDGRYTAEEVNEIMGAVDVDDIFNWRDIELENSGSLDVYYPIVTECEYETIDHSVWE